MSGPVVWLLTCHDGPGLVLYDVLYKLSVCKLECSPGPRLSESGPDLLFYQRNPRSGSQTQVTSRDGRPERINPLYYQALSISSGHCENR